MKFLIIVAAMLGCGGCAGFHSDWRTAEAAAVSGKSDFVGIEGRWDGTWTSDGNAHTGKLRCIVEETDRPGVFEFRYWGTFARIVPFRYNVEYSAERKGDVWHLEGESDLGLLGGIFHHRARICDRSFEANYSSKWDNGVFELRRP